MRRRRFIALVGGVLASPLAVRAQQQTSRIHRIGFLAGGAASDIIGLGSFRQGLRELGWTEGQNIVIDYRFAEGTFERLPDLAAELIRLKVDMIVAVPTPAAVAAKNATD